MQRDRLIIDNLLLIDENGMPEAPTIRQLIDKDVRELYTRDKSKDKSGYVKDCIVIYYLGDPKSPAKQSGLSDAEALKMAIEQAGLPANYIPSALVLKIIKRYYAQNNYSTQLKQSHHHPRLGIHRHFHTDYNQ